MLEIDRDACIRCKACVKECPAYVLEFDEKDGPLEKHPECCIECGHCVAACPVDAVIHEKLDTARFVPVQDHGITIDAFTALCSRRRSVRTYTAAPVSAGHVDRILVAVATAPTGENAQELQYLVVSDPERIQAVKAFMAGKFRTLERLVKVFYGGLVLAAGKAGARRMKSSLRVLNEQYKTHDEDPFLRGATTLLVIHARKQSPMATLDAGIAGTHAVLACETLGIGTVWNGFHVVFCKLFSKLKGITGVPKKHVVLATICMGYPAVSYKKTVARRPLRVTRL